MVPMFAVVRVFTEVAAVRKFSKFTARPLEMPPSERFDVLRVRSARPRESVGAGKPGTANATGRAMS